MARAGIYKSEVVRARDKLLALGRYPSIDSVRTELGNTGSKGTIHRYLKEIEEESGSPAGTKVAVSEAIQDLVGRLAGRLHEEADELLAAANAKHAAQHAKDSETVAQLTKEGASLRQLLERTQKEFAQEQANHAKTNDSHRKQTLQVAQLTQQVTDLQERLVSEERHRQSLEDKHQHAREALEHFRQSVKEQRDQDQRKHEQQVQYLQNELRTVNQSHAAKQQEAMQAHKESARLLTELARAQADLHEAQEEVRSFRSLKEELVFAQKQVEEIGRRLVEQQSAANALTESNAGHIAQADAMRDIKQRLELELATSKATAVAQEKIVQTLLQRITAEAEIVHEVPKVQTKGKVTEKSYKTTT